MVGPAKRMVAVLGLALFGLLGPVEQARANGQERVVVRARIALDSFLDDPNFAEMRVYVQNAYAVLIVPELLKAVTGAEPSLKLVMGNRTTRKDTWLRRISSRVANRVRGGLLRDGTPVRFRMTMTRVSDDESGRILEMSRDNGATWSPARLPLPTGEHIPLDPNAELAVGEGEVRVAIPRFSLSHDSFQSADSPKYLAFSTRQSRKGEISSWKAFVPGFSGKLAVEATDRASLDIADAQAVERLVERIRPRLILNAAAYTAVDRAEEEREAAFAVNAKGPQNLARAAKAAGAKLVHVSTDYVFDGAARVP